MSKAQSVRNFVTFEADFPDDGVFTESGDLIAPAGKNIAESLVSVLREQGLEATDVVQHSFYGWQFTVIRNNCHFWFLLQCSDTDEWLLLSQPRLSFIEKLTFKNTVSAHREVLTIVHECLNQDRRFGSIRWFTKSEYEKRKSPTTPGGGLSHSPLKTTGTTTKTDKTD